MIYCENCDEQMHDDELHNGEDCQYCGEPLNWDMDVSRIDPNTGKLKEDE